MGKNTRDDFRKKFPNLVREMGSTGTVQIDAVRTSAKEAEKATHSIHGYEPTVIDFIRRCESHKQALEVIDFLENQEEIEPGYAKRLRGQLVRLGLRSFGPKKNPGCYEQG
jgi:hypothetical protein